MLTPTEAAAQVAASVRPLPVETLPLPAAFGRCLREAVRAERDQPPFDRVAMDGIAIASAAVALVAVGAALSLFSGRSALRGGLRMLLIGAGAGAATWSLGQLLGVAVT